MMAAAETWITGIVAVAALLYLVRCLVGGGALRRTADFVGGLILIAAVLQPLSLFSGQELRVDLHRMQRQMESRREELEEETQQALSQGIAQRSESYILDKGKELGLELAVKVETKTGEEGIPLPYAAEVTGPVSGVLADIMEQDLGIPRERQVWYEREN